MLNKKIFLDLKNIYINGVTSVLPEKLITRNVFVENRNSITICDKSYNIEHGCYVVGFGKAVLGMAMTLEKILGESLQAGLISVPVGIVDTMKVKPHYKPTYHTKINILEGAANNLPDSEAENNAKEILKFIDKTETDSMLIVLISGGGSALFPVPKPPLSLVEKLAIIKHCIASGATINEINMIRKQISLVKGGGLAKMAFPRQIVSLIISDVIGNPLSLIASGPTVRNDDTEDEIRALFDKYNIRSMLPEIVYSSIFSEFNNRLIIAGHNNVDNYIIGSNKIALKNACELASKLGYAGCIVSGSVEGNVESISIIYVELANLIIEFIQCELHSKDEFVNRLTNVGNFFNMTQITKEQLYREILNFKTQLVVGICLVMGGEPTVIIEGDGIGGRSQQLALQFSKDMAAERTRQPNVSNAPNAFLLCAGTDGIDGPTDAAGAIGYEEQFRDAVDLGFDPVSFLKRNDSYNYYSKLRDGEYLLKIGHTGTNVMDLHILVIANSISTKKSNSFCGCRLPCKL